MRKPANRIALLVVFVCVMWAAPSAAQMGCNYYNDSSVNYVWGHFVCSGWGSGCGECAYVDTGDYCVADESAWGCHVNGTTSFGIFQEYQDPSGLLDQQIALRLRPDLEKFRIGSRARDDVFAARHSIPKYFRRELGSGSDTPQPAWRFLGV